MESLELGGRDARTRSRRSLLALGPYRFDEAYDIEPIDAGCRLHCAVAVSALIPAVHSFLEVLHLGPATRRALAGSLENIKRLCESEP